MESEFGFIDKIKSKYGARRIGDDCAVLPKDDQTDLLVTADLLVEDIDFRLQWTKPESLGHKTLAVSLSDIAAMGGDPTWAMLSVGIPNDLWKTDLLDRFYEGWHKLANQFGVELVGGDVSKVPDKLVIDSIVGGEVHKGRAILRSGARAGDSIFVSGTLGGAAGGLALLESSGFSTDISQDMPGKQLEPQPQIAVGKQLQSLHLATSMIDLSDGLSSDLHHLCKASGVGAIIDAQQLPIHPDLTAHFHETKAFEMAINGGEDFELLFTGDEEAVSRSGISGITRIGEVTPNEGVVEIIHNLLTAILEPRGYRHF